MYGPAGPSLSRFGRQVWDFPSFCLRCFTPNIVQWERFKVGLRPKLDTREQTGKQWGVTCSKNSPGHTEWATAEPQSHFKSNLAAFYLVSSDYKNKIILIKQLLFCIQFGYKVAVFSGYKSSAHLYCISGCFGSALKTQTHSLFRSSPAQVIKGEPFVIKIHLKRRSWIFTF